jgi:hypothetical protein
MQKENRSQKKKKKECVRMILVVQDPQFAASVDRTQCLQISIPEVGFSLALSQVS